MTGAGSQRVREGPSAARFAGSAKNAKGGAFGVCAALLNRGVRDRLRLSHAARALCSFIALRAVMTLGRGDDSGLNTWVKRVFKVDSLRFLTAAQAPKVITALKAMKLHKARAA